MSGSDSEIRKVVQLAVEDRQEEAEKIIEGIVEKEKENFRIIAREEINRAITYDSKKLKLVRILSVLLGFLFGLVPAAVGIIGSYVFGIEINALSMMIWSFILLSLGGFVGWFASK